MDNPSNPTTPRILIVVAAMALVAVGVGGWLSLRGLGLDQPAPQAGTAAAPAAAPADTAAIKEPSAAVKGRKRPEAYGFPSYPTATDYHSMEVSEEVGSSAYSVKRGSSAEIARFYIEKLGAAGWQYRWKRVADVRPGAAEQKLRLKGTRVRWVRRRDGKQLTLLALDDPQKGRTAQAVLSWGPITPAETRK